MTKPVTIVRATSLFLYKYGSVLPYLQEILLKHQLYFSSPAQLNDPLDTRPRFVVTSRAAALRDIIDAFRLKHAHDLPPAQIEWHIGEMTKWVQTLSSTELAKYMARSFHEEMEKHRLYSMTTRPDNEYLWKRYAARHTGWCLEFENKDLFAFAYHVFYRKERRIDYGRHNANNEWKFMSRKTLRYKAEEEVRIYRFPRGGPPQVLFDPTLLTRIILGKNMTEECRRIINKWCRARVPNARRRGRVVNRVSAMLIVAVPMA